jgi:cysteinyl-tRNA synthetase
MSKATLGETLDIHIGGIEHIQVHHTNEIAQSESANGVKYVNYWMHHEMIEIDGGKMSKSKGNVYTLDDLINKGFEPLVLRYFFILSHYRSKQNFTFEALEASSVAYSRLISILQSKLNTKTGKVDVNYKEKFMDALSDDFNVTKALSVLWDLVKDKTISDEDIIATVFDFDKVFGLSLSEKAHAKIEVEKEELEPEIAELIKARQEARDKKDWVEADRLRKDLKDKFNYNVIDK